MTAKRIQICILTLSLFIGTFAVNLQTPMYSIYADQSGVGATAVTIAFSAYVAGLIPTLLFLGGLSDLIGRRLPIALSLMLGMLATILLVIYPNWISLFTARTLLGIGTGLITTAGTVYMTEIMGRTQSPKAALIVTSATSLGFGSGALITSISLKIQGATLMPASFVFFLIVAGCGVFLMRIMPVSSTRNDVPIIRFPFYPLNTKIFGLAMSVAWATTGMIIAVIPLALKNIGLGDYNGLIVFLSIFIGFLCQPIARRLHSHKSIVIGMLLTICGFITIIIGIFESSIGIIVIGTSMTSSSSYGFTYLSSLFVFSSRTEKEKARATAGMFIYAYIGFSVPVIACGILADKYGILSALTVFSFIQALIGALIISSLKKHDTMEFKSVK
ncbi:MFS transporter [Salmonella enterica subsp. enterica]|nr:MFS transporter [Salmonella enterica subsp. enterica serovar Mikawasima]EDN7229168.1 MFS transporter [Salmonella enterica subsp. enterica serovar Mikawasima]